MKPFKDTAVGAWLTTNAPGVLTIIGNFVPAPIKGTLDILKTIVAGQPSLTDAQKQDFNKVADDFELTLIADDQADRANARAREIAIATNPVAPLINKIITPFLAIAVTLGFFGILVFLLLSAVPQRNEAVLYTMLGSLGTVWITIAGYYYGSSAGSAAKSAQIEQMTQSK